MAGYSKSVISKIVANNAISASYALTSFYTSGGGKGSFSGSFTGSFIGNILGTASWAASSSNAISASYVPLLAGPNITINYQSNGIAITGSAGGSGTPGGLNTQIQFNSASVFSGSSNLTFDYTNNNLLLTGSLNITGSLVLDQALTYFSSVNATIAGDNNLFILNTGSYRSAFGKYTLYSSSNARAGEFITVWNDGTVRYYDNSTTDIGDTSTMTFYSIISSGQIYIISSGGTNWTVKMLTTFI